MLVRINLSRLINQIRAAGLADDNVFACISKNMFKHYVITRKGKNLVLTPFASIYKAKTDKAIILEPSEVESIEIYKRPLNYTTRKINYNDGKFLKLKPTYYNSEEVINHIVDTFATLNNIKRNY